MDIEFCERPDGERPNKQVRGIGRAELREDVGGRRTRSITYRYLAGEARDAMAEMRASMPRIVIRLEPARWVVQFSPDLRDRVADGSVTVSYRLWSRPKVKVGGTYSTASVVIEVDDIELLPFSSITHDDLARTGEPDLESLRRRAAHAGPIHDDTLLYRVEFHVVPLHDRQL